MFFKRFIVAGSCMLVVVNCNHASVQETSSSLRVSDILAGGSVESQEIEIIKSEMKKRKPVKTFLQEFINNILPANLLCVFASANYVNGLRIKMFRIVGKTIPLLISFFSQLKLTAIDNFENLYLLQLTLVISKVKLQSAIHQSFLYFSINKNIGLKCTHSIKTILIFSTLVIIRFLCSGRNKHCKRKCC